MTCSEDGSSNVEVGSSSSGPIERDKAMVSAIERNLDMENDEENPLPRTELDTHANMVVLGANAYVYDGINGNTCEVVPYDPKLGSAENVPIVDGAVAYDCPKTMETYILVYNNALHIPLLQHNLVPPFIMREAGIVVNDTAKIHLDQPNSDDHAILVKDYDLRIPLQLHGIFSFYHTRKPTLDEVLHKPKVFMTPDSANWDPYSDHFSKNEESMTDWRGEIMEDKDNKRRKISSAYSKPMRIDDYEEIVDKVI